MVKVQTGQKLLCENCSYTTVYYKTVLFNFKTTVKVPGTRCVEHVPLVFI